MSCPDVMFSFLAPDVCRQVLRAPGEKTCYITHSSYLSLYCRLNLGRVFVAWTNFTSNWGQLQILLPVPGDCCQPVTATLAFFLGHQSWYRVLTYNETTKYCIFHLFCCKCTCSVHVHEVSVLLLWNLLGGPHESLRIRDIYLLHQSPPLAQCHRHCMPHPDMVK